MKILMISGLLLLASCSTNNAPAPKEPTAPKAEENMKEGWQDIKKGSSEVASGVADGAKSAGTAMHSVVCPIAGDRRSGLYYAKDSAGYKAMLNSERPDDRVCFTSEANAREKGFKLKK